MTTGTAYAATATSPPPGDGRSVTMSASGATHKLRYGQQLRLGGGAAAGAIVRLEQAPAGRAWRLVAQTRSAADGSYAFSVRARESGAYRAVAGAKASGEHRVTVIAGLSGRASRNSKIGHPVRVRGRLRPGFRGRRVRLQLRSRGGWKTVDGARTSRGGRFRGSWTAPRAGSYRLRLAFGGDRRNAAVSKALRGRVYVYRPAHASWYGDGFYGGRTACGYTLDAEIKGVANKSLPCGTRVRFLYHGHSTVAKVIDRGPYSGDREWDLAPATRRALGFGDVGTVWSTR